MTIDYKTIDEKIQHDINREEQIPALFSGKINKYEYLKEDILPFDQSRITEQAKFTYSRLSKASKN